MLSSKDQEKFWSLERRMGHIPTETVRTSILFRKIDTTVGGTDMGHLVIDEQ